MKYHAQELNLPSPQPHRVVSSYMLFGQVPAYPYSGDFLNVSSSMRACRGTVLIGFEQANHYTIFNEAGEKVALMAEDLGGLAKGVGRQALGTHRPFTATVFSPDGTSLPPSIIPFPDTHGLFSWLYRLCACSLSLLCSVCTLFVEGSEGGREGGKDGGERASCAAAERKNRLYESFYC